MVTYLGDSVMPGFISFNPGRYIFEVQYTRLFSKNVADTLIFYSAILTILVFISRILSISFKNITGTDDN
jgi:hypothetical protein